MYRQYTQMFKEELTEKALLEYKPWDHEIKLQEGKQLTKERIYYLSKAELKVLRKYIIENLKKGFIRRLESPVGYPIIFVLKKDSKLRPCINFRKLNEIIIKNLYLLPNITELQDRLAGA